MRHIGSNLRYMPAQFWIALNVANMISVHSDLYVTVQLWTCSKPLTVPVQTSYKPFRTERRWNEWLQLPISYRSLPADSCLAITIWDVSPSGGKASQGHAIPFGGTTLPMFDAENQIQKGRQKCLVHRHKIADGTLTMETPAILTSKKKAGAGDVGVQAARDAEELERMESLFKKHEMGDIPRADWLDQLVFRDFENRGLKAAESSLKLLERRRRLDNLKSETTDDMSGQPSYYSNPPAFVLNVELPRFDFPVVFADHEYDAPPISALASLHIHQSGRDQHQAPEVQFGPGINAVVDSMSATGARIANVYDPEVGQRDNLAETKHRRLFRSSHRHGILDKDLKPNAKVRDELNTIMNYSPTHTLTPEEMDLVWKFRYHLTRDKRALTKFAKSVNWNDQSESKQAIQVLGRWTEIDVDDALELLGSSFSNPAVRSYAVDRLRKADDHELLLYLLQLVQALKYEHISTEVVEGSLQDSSLALFLIQRAASNFLLGNYFYWYLMVECDDKSPEQAMQSRDIYGKVAYDFMRSLTKQSNGNDERKTLLRQAELVAVLSKIAVDVRTSGESMSKRADKVKSFFADPSNELIVIDPPLPLPLDPSIEITGIIPDQVTVFKSSLSPIKCTFRTVDGQTYPIIFKVGDDLRQDQLVIQIITLMDQLLQKENLDLKLLPYKILATSTAAGASQFVQSQSLSSIVGKFKGNPALAYLKYHNPDNTQALGVRQEALDTYVRSCAGYCVITYILGVGDRHLDNLLLAPDGHFFHADFGYILGRDPKPFAPLMKLSKEMVDCMGGVQSEHYKQFRQYCFLAYAALRKSSNLILNLFSLMIDANIPDIRLEPDKAVLKVRERFHLELNEEEAMVSLGRVIDDALASYAPVVIDKLHEWAQALRN
ncbi:hypothetical protein LLEC1_03579 [Akanthomyces lecanii]|uniref:Phosphatidylinositol 3-kinase VPS34 n=1 Tax=Cordyceps confragosa TaxID=2714763 RepID=A0A179I8Y4_CORDF|nr:hypothetical protein LLEC1_03579 [Akanthomyces lecanii]